MWVYGSTMAEPIAALVPMFRSRHQMQILAEVFWGTAGSTGSELARRTGIPQQTVAREVARLEQAGVLVTEQVGSAKIIRPASDLPYGPVLRQLLAWVGQRFVVVRRVPAGPVAARTVTTTPAESAA